MAWLPYSIGLSGIQAAAAPSVMKPLLLPLNREWIRTQPQIGNSEMAVHKYNMGAQWFTDAVFRWEED